MHIHFQEHKVSLIIGYIYCKEPSWHGLWNKQKIYEIEYSHTLDIDEETGKGITKPTYEYINDLAFLTEYFKRKNAEILSEVATDKE